MAGKDEQAEGGFFSRSRGQICGGPYSFAEDEVIQGCDGTFAGSLHSWYGWILDGQPLQ
jgi:hypothetical protein